MDYQTNEHVTVIVIPSLLIQSKGPKKIVSKYSISPWYVWLRASQRARARGPELGPRCGALGYKLQPFPLFLYY